MHAIGCKAHAALSASGGVARVLARLKGSTYLVAGDVILWLGRAEAPLHPRAILTDDPVPPRDTVHLDVGGRVPWRPAPLPCGIAPATMRSGMRGLVGGIAALGTPDGFGALLAGAVPVFPLDAAVPHARALATACAADDAGGAAAAGRALLGLGPGLTPAGDDLVGGAFFARAMLARGAPDAWRRAGQQLLGDATALTHPISAALLSDLVDGHAHAPLHDLGAALVDRQPGAALDAARRLVRLGHSSGWDLLTGFAAGTGALSV